MEPTPIHLGSHCGTWHVQSEGCKNLPLSYNLGMDRLILTKCGVCCDHIGVRTCRCTTRPSCDAYYTGRGWGTSARARVQMPHFPYLGNGLTNCAEFWFVVIYQLAWCFTKVLYGVHVHVRTCAPLFRISETAGRIAPKLGSWLDTTSSALCTEWGYQHERTCNCAHI